MSDPNKPQVDSDPAEDRAGEASGSRGASVGPIAISAMLPKFDPTAPLAGTKFHVAPPTDPSVEEIDLEKFRTLAAQQDKLIAAMIRIFAWLNGAVGLLIFLGFIVDEADMIWLGGYNAANRFVDSKVLMSLIGATVIQAGLAFITIVKYLFPATGEGSRPQA